MMEEKEMDLKVLQTKIEFLEKEKAFWEQKFYKERKNYDQDVQFYIDIIDFLTKKGGAIDG